MRSSCRFVEIGILLVAVVVVSPQLSSSSSPTRRTAAPMAAAQEGRGPLVGGVQDAPGRENDLHTIDLARFAVDEHNKKTNALLEFERLVKVRQQVVAGLMYYFTVQVKEGGEKKLYEAKVWEKTWENFKELQDFKPAADAAST